MESGRTIELVVCDLDGTLLRSDGSLSAANAAAIRKARRQGVELILATGKTRESALPIIEALDLTLPGVFFQGHLICDAGGRVLREKAMDRGVAEEVLAYITGRGLYFVVYDSEGIWALKSRWHPDVLPDKYGEPRPRLIDSPAESRGINKIMVSTRGAPDDLRQDLERRFGGRLRVLSAVAEFVELMSPEVSKGEGVAWLLDHLGVDRQRVLAIGDGENDVEMLRLAGIGVAVGNAAEAAKSAADAVVSSNDRDGVAEALRRFL